MKDREHRKVNHNSHEPGNRRFEDYADYPQIDPPHILLELWIQEQEGVIITISKKYIAGLN